MKKTNKIISILLAVAMLLSMIPLSFTVSAAPDTDYTGYYTIKNAGNLAWFACLVVGDTSQSGITAAKPDAKAVLTADIDVTVLASTLKKTWVGIGTEEIPFTGIFDGNGYTIKGLTTDTSLTKSSVATVAVDTTKQGLFGVIGEGGVVRDVIVEGTAILSDTIQYGGICSENNGTIENVVSLVTVMGGDNADEFCHTNNGTITNSFITDQTTAVTSGVTFVDAVSLADGSVTHALGSSFGQIIGTDTQPVHFDGSNKVYRSGNEFTNTKPETPEFSGGTGIISDPFLLATADDLVSLKDFVISGGADAIDDVDDCSLGAFHGYYFKMIKDIDMSDVEDWTPFNFNGTFDGAGHTISNMQMNENFFESADASNNEYKSAEYEAAFFGQVVHANIKNLYFENCTSEISDGLDPSSSRDIYVAIVATTAIASSFENVSAINCTVIQNGEDGNFSYSGGLVGYADICHFDFCSFDGTITTGGDATGSQCAGGLVGGWGDMYYEYITDYGNPYNMVVGAGKDFGIYNSFSTAEINNPYFFSSAGIVGFLCTDFLSAEIENCAFGGKITAGGRAAGIMGEGEKNDYYIDCVVYAEEITTSNIAYALGMNATLVTNCKISDKTVISGTKETQLNDLTPVTLAEDEEKIEDFKSNLHGKLADGMADVEITLSQDGTVKYTAVTDADGEFNFGKQVLRGDYTLNIAESDAAQAYETEYTIEYATNHELDITRVMNHTHSFEYTAGLNGRIVATCVADGCTLENGNGGTITISAPADLYADGVTVKEAVIDDQLVESVDYTVTYSTADGKAPATAGTYTATLTIGEAAATVKFTIVKRNAEASNFIYTAPANLVFDGSAKFATVELSSEITGMGEITVSYYKDGVEAEPINIGTYTVKVSTAESDKYYAIKDVEIGTFTISAQGISNATITLGDALTYNGAEQTQEVAKVEIPAGLDVTYSVSGNKATNVGVYQLTVTGTGNFEGEVTALYEIAPDTSGIDDLTVYNVTSSDKAAVEAVKAQIDNAVTDLADSITKADYKAISDKCDELLTVIYTIEDELARIEKALYGYDVETVTSADKDDIKALDLALLQFELIYSDNLTSDQSTTVMLLETELSHLKGVIDDVADEITRIETAVNAYGVPTVKSTDKADIEQLVADIKVLTDGQNITADERAKLEALDAKCDELLAKIAETTSEYDRVISAANGYDKTTVTSADKDTLTQLNSDIYALALTDNVTSSEKTQLMTAHINAFGCIQKVTYVSEELKRIIEAVDKYVFESVKSTDKADIQQLVADIRTLLDGQNITADERTLLENADATCDKLIAKIDETVAEISRIDEATNAYDIDTVTSADKADIEQLIADIKALTDGDNITDEERAQLVANDETLGALLAKINATAEEIARIEEAVNSYDEDTVKSTDKAGLEQLKADIKALTDATNITEDERTALEALDATADALIKKIDDTKAEIKRINEAVNGYDEETVTSADIMDIGKLIEDIKALTDGDNLTEDEKAALEANNEAIDALVEKLTEVAEEIKRVDESVKSYDEDAVKSTDSEDLAQLKEDVQALIDSTNTTENEKTVLKEMINTIEGLEDKIAETEAQLEEIKGIENGYDSETVTSNDKAAIEDVIAKIEAVNPDNLTPEQKAEYEEIKAGFEALLEKIEAAENAVAEIGAELEMFDEDRVTIFWEDDIEALKAKIDELLADENMGQPEKAKLNEYKAQAEKLIEIINTPREYLSLRFFYLIWDCLNWKWNGLKYLFDLIF